MGLRYIKRFDELILNLQKNISCLIENQAHWLCIYVKQFQLKICWDLA